MDNENFITLMVGRIAMLYKGEYDSNVTYNFLDCISYNGSLYLCIKESKNKLPNDKNYWIPCALSAYSLAVEKGFSGTQEEWLNSLKAKSPVKGEDYFTDEDKLAIINELKKTEDFKNLFSSKVDSKELENYEKKHTYYTMTVTEEIEAEQEVEIPCSYIVGNDELIIYHNGDRLLCEKSEDDEANYREVRQAGERSNKVIFGWDLRIGDVFDFIVKGVVENEENEN